MMHLYRPKIVTYMNILAEWTIILCFKLYSSEQVLLVSLPNIFAFIFFLSELTGITGSGSQSVSSELIILALPAIVGQAIEPLSQLMETAYIGRLGTHAATFFKYTFFFFTVMVLTGKTLQRADNWSQRRKIKKIYIIKEKKKKYTNSLDQIIL